MSFAGLSDGAWANQMVYIFAEIINATFESVEPFHAQGWYELDNAVENWFRSKPDMFSPLFIPSQQKKTNSQSEKEVFPGMWLLHPAHVVGMQYYYLARLLLVPSDPRKARLGFGTIRTWRETEVTLPLTLKNVMHWEYQLNVNRTQATMRTHLRNIVGLAISNPHVVGANFEASHILHACESFAKASEQCEIAYTNTNHLLQQAAIA
jgi:hypothetical protein